METVLELEENISHPHYSNIIVEEPELNLFPETQKDLIYDLLEMINSGRDHLLMTTHSPYLLYALNNCMLGALVQENIPEEDVARIVTLMREKIEQMVKEGFSYPAGGCFCMGD